MLRLSLIKAAGFDVRRCAVRWSTSAGLSRGRVQNCANHLQAAPWLCSRSMSILSRLRKKESMAAEERKTDIWSKAAAAAQSQPEQAVVGESTTDSVPNGNAEPEADDDLKSGYLALEAELLREPKPLPLMPMNVPSPEQIRKSGLSAWDLPLKSLPSRQPENPKSLTVAIVGIPNAGKSTLMNQLLQLKLATVSHREQTTRDRILAILTNGDTQIVIHDTPGIVEYTRARRLGVSKVVANDGVMAAEEADAVMVLIDPTLNPPERQFDMLKGVPIKDLIIVINKIDKVKPPSALLPLVDSLLKHSPVPAEHVMMVSALTSSGVEDLRALLVSKAQPRPWAYPAEHTTEMSPLKRISEQVREKYMGIGTEVPYVFKQRTRQIGFAPDGTLDIHHEIIVPKGSQKGILLGKGGGRINSVKNQVEEELEQIFNCRVRLMITVDVNKKVHALPLA